MHAVDIVTRMLYHRLQMPWDCLHGQLHQWVNAVISWERKMWMSCWAVLKDHGMLHLNRPQNALVIIANRIESDMIACEFAWLRCWIVPMSWEIWGKKERNGRWEERDFCVIFGFRNLWKIITLICYSAKAIAVKLLKSKFSYMRKQESSSNYRKNSENELDFPEPFSSVEKSCRIEFWQIFYCEYLLSGQLVAIFDILTYFLVF